MESFSLAQEFVPTRNVTQTGGMSTTYRVRNVMLRYIHDKYLVHTVWCRGKKVGSLCYLLTSFLASLSLFPHR